MMRVMEFDARVALTFWERARGLIARHPAFLDQGELLCLAPCSSVHTFFMSSAIDVAFLDARGVVLRAVRGLAPWRIAVSRGASYALERPSNCEAPWPAEGDGVALSICWIDRKEED